MYRRHRAGSENVLIAWPGSPRMQGRRALERGQTQGFFRWPHQKPSELWPPAPSARHIAATPFPNILHRGSLTSYLLHSAKCCALRAPSGSAAQLAQ